MLKNPKNASTRSASTEKSPIISTASPFVLRLSKDERRFFSRIYDQYLQNDWPDFAAWHDDCLPWHWIPRFFLLTNPRRAFNINTSFDSHCGCQWVSTC